MRNASTNPDTRTIRVNALARVEGEGALHLTMQGERVTDARLDIFEPPRFYEAFLRGRDYREVPDITARICGICPVAHQMTSAQALEEAMGATNQIDPVIRQMRNLLVCGEWIESHVLHIFMLHLPDFLGKESVISMVDEFGPVVKQALRIKKLGNDIVTTLAGRSVHPINVCVGGFYSLPAPEAFSPLIAETERCLAEMSELTLFLAEKIDYPDLEQDYEFVALQPDREYPLNQGPIASSKGVKVEPRDYLNVIEEQHVEHRNALHSVMKGRGPYHVGPLARLNLNAEKLHPRAAELLPRVCDGVRRPVPWRNSFLSMPARALETVHCLALALDIMKQYRQPARTSVPIRVRVGVGASATEAPRGVLFHRYEVSVQGLITGARIIPPTSQNLRQIDSDLRVLAEKLIPRGDEALTLGCEHLIRNYDPCISCATHFLKVHVERLP